MEKQRNWNKHKLEEKNKLGRITVTFFNTYQLATVIKSVWYGGGGGGGG